MQFNKLRRLALSALFLLVVCASAQTGKEYPDGHGGQVFFPLGDISFADELVAFEPGDPRPNEKYMQSHSAVGIPDYKRVSDDTYFTLSCRGVLTLRFVDNALIDVDGPDLYVFEIGPDIEPTDLAISEDGREWIEVGGISGGRAEIDIADLTEPGAVFHYVRLTDGGTRCTGQWPGADIDAVGAIGAGRQISLDSSLLFDTGEYDLKPEAETMLSELAAEMALMRNASVVVEGHTDSVGSDADNRVLSENRAQSVMTFLKKQSAISGYEYSTRGYGESRPVADNDTEEGRAKNRRVDLVVAPKSQ